MRAKLYLVFDRAQNEHLPPIVSPTEMAARRLFERAVNGADKMISEYPDSYDLRLAGEIDTVTGEIVPCTVVHVCTARELLRPKEAPGGQV